MNTTSARRFLGSLVASLICIAACASSPPPAPSPPPTIVPTVDDTVPSAATEVDSGSPSEDAQPQAQVECQTTEDCKSRGESGAGTQWICESGRCASEPIPEVAKQDEKAVADQPAKSGKKKAKKK